MNERRAVVIGAGLGGLAAGIRLAARGWQVTICERSGSPGGKMNRLERDGFRFDTGPSLVTMPWVFEETYAAAGERLEDHVELMKIDPLAAHVYPDGTRFDMTSSLPDLMHVIRDLHPGDERGFLRFLEVGARIFELSQGTFFRRPPGDPPDMIALRALRHLPVRHAWGNYHSVVSSLVKGVHLRQLLDRYPTYVGSSPYASPATLAVIPYIEIAFGGHYVAGGLYRIVSSLTAIAARLGVEILLDAEVEAIERSGGRVSAARLADGRRLKADVVVMNGDASMTPSLLGDPSARPLAEPRRSLSGFVLLIGLRRPIEGLKHHTVYFGGDYRSEFEQLFGERRFPDDPTVYINAPSRSDPSAVPAGGEGLFIMANAPANDGDAWDAGAVARARERVFLRLSRSGFPEIERDIIFEETWTPKRIATSYAMPGGAIYGTHSHGWRSAFMRPPNRDRRVGGLYYVGGSTHPGGGTPTVLMSARITTDLIERHEQRP